MTVPKFHTESLGMLPEKFFSALGHLQYAFTSLEVTMVCHIRAIFTQGYANPDHRFLTERIDAVLGGMRMDGAKDTFKRLLRVAEAPPALTAYISDLFAQVSEIQYFRNRLTHYHTARWFRKRGDFVNTDIEVAREYEKSVTIRFDYEAMEAARHDLHAIAYYLDKAMPHEDEPETILEPPAWRYKPSMLTR